MNVVFRHRRRIMFSVFAIGCIVIAVWLARIAGDVNSLKAQRQAEAAAKAVAAEERFTSCLQSIPFLIEFNRAMRAGEDVASVLLRIATTAHEYTSPSTPGWAEQERDIALLERSIASGGGVRVPVPTRAQCAQRRERG